MKKELRKTFQTGEVDAYGFRNDLDILVEFDTTTRKIKLLKVSSYSWRTYMVVDLTDIFKSQLFQSVINGIDWQHLYSHGLINEVNERVNIPYEMMMVSNALTQ